jgi:hypothetical protein
MVPFLPVVLVVVLVVSVLACFIGDAVGRTPPVQATRTQTSSARISPLVVVLVVAVLIYFLFGSQIAGVLPLFLHGKWTP